MYLKIENEFNEYCKKEDTIKFNATDDNEKKNLELNLSMMKTELKSIEVKRKKLQEYVYADIDARGSTYSMSFISRKLRQRRVTHCVIAETFWKRRTGR